MFLPKIKERSAGTAEKNRTAEFFFMSPTENCAQSGARNEYECFDATGAVNSCYFHWKHANRRKLLKLRIPKEMITRLIGEDSIKNFLSAISYDKIPEAMQSNIQSKMEKGAYVREFGLY